MNSQICYAAWANSDEIRNNSSSGGIFSALAEYVIEERGIVFGAFQENNNDLHHIGITKKSDLKKIQKSKYFQSRADVCYLQVKNELEKGTLVLFSGTACQVAGLKGFLGNREYRGELFTVEILCHGVSNADVYCKYLTSQEKRFRKRIITSEFRTKNVPWQEGSVMTLCFEDGSKKLIRSNEDDYYIGFNGNVILRPSCYHCVFTGLNRKSDILLADFWGLDNKIVPENVQTKGVSLVLLTTDYAQAIWQKISDKVNFIEADIQEAIQFNLALSRPAEMQRNRALFFANFRNKDFHKLILVCCFRERLYYTIWKIVGDKGMSVIKGLLRK